MIAARVLLALLLAVQALMVAFVPPHAFYGDEGYYVRKAEYFARHFAFEKADPAQMAVEDGAWGTSDWRPQGYPLFVALCSGGNFAPDTIRRRVSAGQFALIALAVIVAFEIVARRSSPRRRLLVALVLGLAPWPYEFVVAITPDSCTASLLFLGLVQLWRRRFFTGALLTTATFLFRPEMIALAALMIGIALLVPARRRSLRRRDVAAAAIAFMLLAGAHYAYRVRFTGRTVTPFFAPFAVFNFGAFDWANSWLGTEREAYEFVFGLTGRQRPFPPDRAFADAGERQAVKQIEARARAEGYSKEMDDELAALAARRRREHPWSALVAPRLFHTAHLWINVEMNMQLLIALRPVPRPVRRAFLGSLLLMKGALLVAFLLAVVSAARRRMAEPDLVWLMASFVVARTLLIGIVIHFALHRYVLPAWLPLIVCAMLPRGNVHETGRLPEKISS